jgi:3-methyl-2-oxobutanoate hydroxymethyltransferase
MPARVTAADILARKSGTNRLVSVTAYDAATGAMLDEAGVDIVLVGDSVGNVVLGHDSTIPVTMRDMVHHLRAVRRGVKRALVVADMPFLSYQPGVRDAIKNAGRFLKEGADAVKVEGGAEVVDSVRAIVEAGIPVMGHVGFTPQRIREYGANVVQGKDASSAFRIWRAARALDGVGVFSIVLEVIPVGLARAITDACRCPTIGIGAGGECDGQVLVFHDLVGLNPTPPAFVKRFGNAHEIVMKALAAFSSEVKAGGYPESGTRPDLPPEEADELKRMIASSEGK